MLRPLTTVALMVRMLDCIKNVFLKEAFCLFVSSLAKPPGQTWSVSPTPSSPVHFNRPVQDWANLLTGQVGSEI